MIRALSTLAFALVVANPAAAQERTLVAADYAADAVALDTMVAFGYAYLDRFEGGVPPHSAELDAERDAVHDADSLLHYAEDKLASLADHHAITGRSFRDDWAIVPSYSDLWVEPEGDAYRITAVREDSPAAGAGIVAGDRLVAVGGVPVADAVAAFWAPLGLLPEGDRLGYAARVLAAGRRDRPRSLTVAGADGRARTLELPNLYTVEQRDRPPLTVTTANDGTVIRFNNSVGDDAAVAAFDDAMAAIDPDSPVTIDLRDTPGGGNTVVARAILGWFVTGPTGYQMHNLPLEERQTGVPRQWVEQVLPRAGKYHPGPVRVLVGRWTGSMGEGIAIGFAAMGKPVIGDRMAGLVGAVYDEALPASGLVVKVPAERLMMIDGTPREDFVPAEE
ncbi:S41 family peptidase [Sphingosinithalassobacter portus]|uniref:S41 family peptidase n=1 Tax=Stakelama portus TaxID=2676234 RepID=UPI000D6DD375|nr:PDZ domain-containing protein [Sphingosinithalassobacter portus]